MELIPILVVVWLLVPLPAWPLGRWALNEKVAEWRIAATIVCAFLGLVFGLAGAISIEALADAAWGGLVLGGVAMLVLCSEFVAYVLLLLIVGVLSLFARRQGSLGLPCRRLTTLAFGIAWLVGFVPRIALYNPTEIARESRLRA